MTPCIHPYIVALVWFATSIQGLEFNELELGADKGESDVDVENSDYYDSDQEERLLIVPTFTINISALTSSGTSFLPIALALLTSALALAGTIALGAILISILANPNSDFNDGPYNRPNGHGSNYGSYRSILDLASINWEQFSILDTVNLAMETWNKYEPSNPDCQKKLLCEVHKDTESLGFVAKQIVNAFQYADLVDAISLPDNVVQSIDEYRDAASYGASQGMDCGEIFPGCKFSVTRVVNKFKQEHGHR